MRQSAMQFGPFTLDPADRRLSRGGETVDLNARYMDALILLVQARGELVAKDRFMDEVWRGVPVTDEALTQAIRTLRRALGDSAAAPRFIATVPKHGYRFIAPVAVEIAAVGPVACAPHVDNSRATFIHGTLAGTAGAMLGGALVGVFYGFIGAAQPPAADGGALSLLLVLILVSTLSAGVAGAGIAAGVATSRFVRPLRWYWVMAGGALGGVTVGAFANLIGQDAFRLLFGQAIGQFAGALEGLILGAAVGLAAFLAHQSRLRSALPVAALLGAGAGIVIALMDGRMMAGSLQGLISAFPSSQFRLDGVGRVLGETGLGPIGRAATAAFEGAVFATGLVWALRGGANGRMVQGPH